MKNDTMPDEIYVRECDFVATPLKFPVAISPEGTFESYTRTALTQAALDALKMAREGFGRIKMDAFNEGQWSIENQAKQAIAAIDKVVGE